MTNEDDQRSASGDGDVAHGGQYCGATESEEVMDIAWVLEIESAFRAQRDRIDKLERDLCRARRRVKALRRARREDANHIAKLHRIVGDWRKWFQM